MNRLTNMRIYRWLASFAVVVTLGVVAFGASANAATNNYINFQARLLNSNGSVALDGNYNVSFHIYDLQNGSTGSTDTGCGTDVHCLWSESYTVAGSNAVRVAGGYLSVQLGSSTAFPAGINWDQQLYLTMDIGGTASSPSWDGQMLNSGNRLPLTGVPYAFRSGAAFNIINSSGTTLLSTSGSNVTLPNATGASSALTFGGDATADLYRSAAGTIKTDGNLTVAGNISGSGTIQLSGTGSNYLLGTLGIGTSGLQAGAALTITNGSWLSSVDAAGTGFINLFSVNSSNQIQAGAAIAVDGGIVLPTDAGQVTLSDLPIDSTATAGTKESYTLRVGSSNALTVYGEADGSGNAQNIRIAIGSSITPAYTLDVGGDVNIGGSNAYRIGGTAICTSSGCAPSSGSSSYVQLQGTTPGTAQTGNFNISGTGIASKFLAGYTSTTGVAAFNGSLGIGTSSPKVQLQISGDAAVTSPTLGSASGGFYLSNTDVNYGLLGGVGSSGNAWLQVQRTDATATAYNLLLQPSGGSVTVGTLTANGLLSVGTNTTTAAGGIYLGTDTDLYRSGVGVLKTDGSVTVGGSVLQFSANANILMRSQTSSTQGILNVALTSDSVDRFTVDTSGKVQWGPGTGALDTSLARTAAGVLTVSNTLNATSALQTNGTTRVDSSGNLTNIGNITSASGTLSLDGIKETRGSFATGATANTWYTLATATVSNTFGTSNLTGYVIIQNDDQNYTRCDLTVSVRGVNTLNTDAPLVRWGDSCRGTFSGLFNSGTFNPIQVVKVADTNGGNKVYELQVTTTDGTWNQFDWGFQYDASSSSITYAVNTTAATANTSLSSPNTTYGGDLNAFGNAIFQSSVNSTTAFQVQNAAAAPIFVVDTTSTDGAGNQVNYLAYPGFESGSFSSASAGWAPVSPATLTQNTSKQQTYNGLYSAQVVTTASNGGMSTNSFAITPTTGTYITSFYAKTSSGNMASTAFTIQTTDGTTHTCSPTAGVTINSNGFQRVYCSITTTGTITALQITQNDSTARTVYIDAVQLQKNSINGNTITAPSAYQVGSIQLRGTITNPITLQNNANSTAAFQVQSANSTAVLQVDTLNGRVAVGSGAVPANGALTVGTNTTANTGGIYFGTDTNLYRSGAGLLETDGRFLTVQSSTGAINLSARTTGDTFDRFNVQGSGQLNWGSGSGTMDTNLYRLTTNTLKTDGNLTVGGTLTTGGATTIQTDSATAFSVKNTAGTSALNVDTTNLLTTVANLQSTGTISLQGADGGSILLRTAANSGTGTNAMTFSGNEITDATRSLDIQGDGRAPSDSSTGIWEGTTNIIPNGGFESNTTGWFASTVSGAPSISRYTKDAVFGTSSMQLLSGTTGTLNSARSNNTFAAVTTYTATAWIKVASGAGASSLTFIATYNSPQTSTQVTLIADNKWHKYTLNFSTDGSAQTSDYLDVRVSGTPTTQYDVRIDGVQLEAKPVATPYVDTNGSIASRNAARVQAPASSMNATTGWMALRARVGIATGIQDIAFLEASDGTSSNRYSLIWNNSLSAWELANASGGVGAFPTVGGSGWSAGTYKTVILTWTSSSLAVSIDGGAFTAVGKTNTPTSLTTIDFGSLLGSSRWIDGDILWAAAGAGTLSSADATAMYGYGNSDPTLASINSIDSASSPTFAWDGENQQYTGTNNDPTLQSGISIDDVNLYHSANGSITLQGATNSTTAFQVQNASGTSVFNVDTTNGYVGIGTTSPATKLDVNGATTIRSASMNTAPLDVKNALGNDIFRVVDLNTNDNGRVTVHDSTGSTLIQLAADTSVYSYINAGNVGIATTSPATTLTVYNGNESTTQTNFTQALTDSGILISTNYTASAYTPGIFWNTTDNNATKPKAGIYLQETGSGTSLLFGTSNSFTAGITNTAFSLDYNGNGTILGNLNGSNSSSSNLYNFYNGEFNGGVCINSASCLNSNAGTLGVGSIGPNATEQLRVVLASGKGATIAGSACSNNGSVALFICNVDTSQVTLAARAVASQTGNILDVQDSSGVNRLLVSAAGNVQILNGSSQNLFVADTGNQRVAIGPAAVAANSALTVGTNTTAASGGIYFGTDTTLFRSNSNALQTGGAFTTGGSIFAGGDVSIQATSSAFLARNADVATRGILFARLSTDTQDRLKVDASGTITWGSGSLAGDTTLYRSVAGSLTVQGTTNSTTAFTVNNSAGSQIFGVDTTNQATNVVNLQATGTIGLQGADGGSILLRTAANSGIAVAMTFSGNEITDATRSLGIQGDGRAPADSSTGIWESTTNLVKNGGFESGIGNTGQNNGSAAQDTSRAKFGSSSAKFVANGGGIAGIFVQYATGGNPGSRVPVSASTTYTSSAWVYSATAINFTPKIEWYDSSNTLITSANGSVQAVTPGVWTRVTVTGASPSNVVGATPVFYTSSTPSSGTTWWTDGMQFEQKAIVTPYVETNGATATRNNARVQAPSSVLSAGQGWVALRARMPFASSVLPHSPNQIVFFNWSDDGTHRISILTSGTNSIRIQRAAGGSAVTDSMAATWNAGDVVTIVAYWTGTSMGISYNGSNFTTLADTTVPTIANSLFDIGSGDTGIFGTSTLDGDQMWFTSGTGTLTNADAAALYRYGNSDPTLTSLNSIDSSATPSFAWDGENQQYSGANADPTLQSGIAIDDVNLYHSANGSLALQGAVNSATAFQVQNNSGATVFNVDTANSLIGLNGSGSSNQGISLSMVVNSAVSANQVVILDTVHAGQVTTTATANMGTVFGVTTTANSAGVAQPIVTAGVYQVMADSGAVNVGDNLVTSTTTGDVMTTPTPSVGAILGQALSSKSAGSPGLVWVKLNPGTGSGDYTPVGTLSAYSGGSVPSGWLTADGSSVLRSAYPELYSVLVGNRGTTTVTIASPGVFTLTSHGLSVGDKVFLETTGALPTGLSADTTYCVATVPNANTFTLGTYTQSTQSCSTTPINTTGTQSGTHTLYFSPYGVPDSSHFYLPDLRGRTVVGVNTTNTFVANLGNNENSVIGSRQQKHSSTYVNPTISVTAEPTVVINSEPTITRTADVVISNGGYELANVGTATGYAGGGGDGVPTSAASVSQQPTFAATGGSYSLSGGTYTATGGSVGVQTNAPVDSGAYLTTTYMIKAGASVAIASNNSFIQNGTSTQTGNFNIQGAGSGNVVAVIQGASGQTADILDIKDSSNNKLLSVDASGNLSVKGSIGFTNSGNANQIMTVNETVTSSVNQYDVVAIDSNNAGQVTTTTLTNNSKVFGIATTTNVAGVSQPIAISGIYQVNADTGAVNIGDYLVMSGTAGKVTDSTTGSAGVIGRAMSAKAAGSNGTVWVYITPSSGGGGGSGGSTNYGLMESDWTNTGATLPTGMSDAATVTVGNTIYMLGGLSSVGSAVVNTIYSAPVSNPTNWTNTGATLPGNLEDSQAAIIGSNLYLFGGINASGAQVNAIYYVPVSSITTTAAWSTVSNPFPAGIGQSQLAIIGSNIYLFGGYNGAVTNAIYTASIGNPTGSWTTASGTLPSVLRYSNVAVIGNYVYLFGGANATGGVNNIYRAPISSPGGVGSWSSVGTLPGNLYISQLAIIGGYVYLFGGHNGTAYQSSIFRAPISNPVSGWTNITPTLPGVLGQSSVTIAGNAVYLYGGNNGSTASVIYSAPIFNGSPDVSSNPSWKTDSNASSGGSGTSSQTASTNYELAYGQTTLQTTITSTSLTSPTYVTAAPSFTADGSTKVRVEIFSPYWYAAAVNGGTLFPVLQDNGTTVTKMGIFTTVGATPATYGSSASGLTYEYIPSAGSHTLTFAAYESGGTAYVGGGTGVGTDYPPAYIRITLANPSLQGGSGINNATTTQTANFNIQSASATNPTAVIQGATSQSADILDVKDGSGNIVFNVGPTGNAYVSGNIGVGSSPSTARLLVASPGNTATSYTAIFQSSASVAGAGGIVFDQNSTYGWKIHTEGTASTGGTLKFNYINVGTGAVQNADVLDLVGGTVGIGGTTSPQEALDVTGRIRGSNDIYTTGEGATRVGFLNPSGSGSGTSYFGLYYDSTNNVGVIGALSGGVSWRNISITSGLCVNTVSCTHTLGVNGAGVASGGFSTGTPDVAEYIDTANDVAAADVVSADPNQAEAVVKSGKAYDSTTVGVIADGTSGFQMLNAHYGSTFNANSDQVDPGAKPMTVAGRVPVKISDENGPIKPGDYLTSASTPGYAMKATHAGSTIGKALGFFGGSDITNPATGTTIVNNKTYNTGKVLVLVNLSYYDPVSSELQGSALDATNTVVSGNLEVDGNTVFKGDIAVEGHIVGNADTSGTITVTNGSNSASYSFSNQYNSAPKVIVSPDGDTGSLHWWVTKSTTEFTVHLSSSAPNSLDFDYMIQQSGP